MGDRANAMTDHRVEDYRDAAAVVAQLSSTIPAARCVRDYWRSVDPKSVETHEAWSVYRIVSPTEGEYLRYDGPGGLCVHFGSRVAIIGADCRWSGFVTMPGLQRVHVAAFQSIARALGGTRMVLIPDYDRVEEMARYDGSSLDECIARLHQCWGTPHPKTEIVTDDVEVYYRRQCPPWYVESLDLAP